MKREEVIAKAQELRAQGFSYAQLEERLGVAGSTLNEWLNPAVRDASLTRNTTDCPRCGNRMSRSSSRCEGCRHDDADRRVRSVERWWAEGVPMPQIASRLGITKGCLAGFINRWREQGYELSYRYTEGDRAGSKFPEQVAA